MLLELLILFLDLLIIFGGLVIILAMTAWLSTGVPFVPTTKVVIGPLAHTLGLTADSVLFDLGCGDGSVLYALSRIEPRARYIGAEKALLPYILSLVQRLMHASSQVSIVRNDFSTLSLQKATHVYLYLFPQLMDQLLPKLVAELPYGARVVTCDFTFSNREADAHIDIPHGKRFHTLHVYNF